MAASTAVNSVVQEWRSMPDLCNYAAAGIVAKVGKRSDLDRLEVSQNAQLLKPIIQHLGDLSVHIDKVDAY